MVVGNLRLHWTCTQCFIYNHEPLFQFVLESLPDPVVLQIMLYPSPKVLVAWWVVIANERYLLFRDLKHRARIPVPGWTLVGVADIHSYLNEGEVFVCIEDEGKRQFLEGPICVSRSPTIHPGDVQIATAIGPPKPGSPFEIEPLQNTIVFSIQGKSF